MNAEIFGQVNGSENCECHRCIKEKGLTVPFGPFDAPLNAVKMILCPECGCKRCPKASDHRLDCTSSNDVGQPGSVYRAAEKIEDFIRGVK